MKHKFVKKTIPLCSVLILSACMSDTKDSFRAPDNTLPENPIQSEFINKGGLTGKVITDKYIKGARVCFDDNLNGFCDITEASEDSFDNGDFSFSKDISDAKQDSILIAQVPVVIEEADGTEKTQIIVLSSNQVAENKSQTISPFTTLVVNEQLYNPFVNNNQNDAISYLADTNLIDLPALQGGDYIAETNSADLSNATNLLDAFVQAFIIKDSDPFFALANVVDEVVKESNLSVNIDTLNPQVRLDQTLSFVDTNNITTWEKHDEDEISLGSDFAKGSNKAVVFSKWHNKLTILDTSDVNVAPPILDSNTFLFVDAPRDAIDADTGASEQELTQVNVSDDGNTIYSMLAKFENESADIGVGVYMSDISSSVIPNTIFATENNPDNFYPHNTVTDIALSPDNTLFGISGDDKKILLFDAGSLRTVTDEITSTKRVKAIKFSNDNSVVYAGLNQKFNNSFAIFDITTKNLSGEFLLEAFPTAILETNDNKVFVASAESNKIFHLDISDKSNITQVEILTASAKVKKLSISNDGKYLIAALTTKQVNAFDLTNTAKVANVVLEDIVVDAFDTGDNNVAIVYGDNINIFSISESEGGNLTDDEKQAWENEHRK